MPNSVDNSAMSPSATQAAAPSGHAFRVVLSLATLAMFMDGFDSLILTLTAPDMVASLGIPLRVFGAVLGFGQIGVALGSLIFGALGDRYNLRAITLCAFALFTASTFATPLAHDAAFLMIVRFVAGLGIGGLKPLLSRYVASFASPALRNAAVSRMFLGYGAGGVVVSLISATFLSSHDWPQFYYLAGGLSLLVFLSLLLGLPKKGHMAMNFGRGATVPPSQALVHAPEEVGHVAPSGASTFLSSFADLFRPELWRVSALLIIAFGMNSATQTYFSYWIPTLIRAAGGTPGYAGLALAIYLVGGIVGGIAFIWVTNRLRPSITSIAFGAVAGFLSLQILGHISYIGPAALIMFALSGMAILGTNYVILGIPATFFPIPILSSGAGLCMFSSSIGAVAGPWLGGYLLDLDLPRWVMMLIGGGPLVLVALSIAALNGRSSNPR